MGFLKILVQKGLIKETDISEIEREAENSSKSLEAVLNIPLGMQSDFYDKLNSITHGSAITSEMKEE